MIEYLSPLATLFKIFMDGLTKASDIVKGGHSKKIQRRIIDIQLSLEDIIDEAQEIISEIDKFENNKTFVKSDIINFKSLLLQQRQNIFRFMNLLSDDVSDDILKLFAPEARRKIWGLINLKGGFIQELIGNIHFHEEIHIKNKQLAIETSMFDWNHDDYMLGGHQYLMRISESMKNIIIPVNARLKEQIKVVDDLIKCSSELSNYIKNKIKIEDIVLRIR